MYNTNQTSKRKSEYYKKFPRDGDCQFCSIPDSERVKEYDGFIVIRNKFGYDIFDMREVEDHLMVIPKKHTDRLDVLSQDERAEFLNILIDYESKGYNVYFREPGSIIKTVDHHHTHLLKLGKRLEHITYSKEPYSLKFD